MRPVLALSSHLLSGVTLRGACFRPVTARERRCFARERMMGARGRAPAAARVLVPREPALCTNIGEPRREERASVPALGNRAEKVRPLYQLLRNAPRKTSPCTAAARAEGPPPVQRGAFLGEIPKCWYRGPSFSALRGGTWCRGPVPSAPRAGTWYREPVPSAPRASAWYRGQVCSVSLGGCGTESRFSRRGCEKGVQSRAFLGAVKPRRHAGWPSLGAAGGGTPHRAHPSRHAALARRGPTGTAAPWPRTVRRSSP